MLRNTRIYFVSGYGCILLVIGNGHIGVINIWTKVEVSSEPKKIACTIYMKGKTKDSLKLRENETNVKAILVFLSGLFHTCFRIYLSFIFSSHLILLFFFFFFWNTITPLHPTNLRDEFFLCFFVSLSSSLARRRLSNDKCSCLSAWGILLYEGRGRWAKCLVANGVISQVQSWERFDRLVLHIFPFISLVFREVIFFFFYIFLVQQKSLHVHTIYRISIVSILSTILLRGFQ